MKTSLDLKAQIQDTFRSLEEVGLSNNALESELLSFVESPFLVMIVGRTNSDAEKIQERLSESFTTLTFVSTDLASVGLCDAIIVCTPADMALSDAELRLIEKTNALRKSVFVEVTRTETLGAGRQQEAGIREISSLRLEPNLTRLGVEFSFSDSEAAISSNTRNFVARAHKRAEGRLHVLPVMDELVREISRAQSDLKAAVTKRDHELEQLEHLQSGLGAIEARLVDLGDLSRLRISEALRTIQADYQKALMESVNFLVSCVEGNPSGERSARVAMDEGWRAFESGTHSAYPLTASAYSKQVAELLGDVLAVASRLEYDLNAPILPQMGEESAEMERSRQLVSACKPEEVFAHALEIVERIKGEIRNREEEDSKRSAVDRLGQGAKHFIKNQFRGGVQGEIEHAVTDRALESIRSPFEKFSDAALEHLKAELTTVQPQIVRVIQDVVREAFAQHEQRYAWSGSLASLTAMKDQFEAIRRGLK